MKILVTGATSGLGRNAAEWLLQQGHQVVGCGRDQHAGAELTAQGMVFQPIELLNLTHEKAQLLIADCDAIWHCAALSAPWGKRADFEAINWQATQILANVAGEMNVAKFVHISTPAIYFNFSHQQQIPESQSNTQFANDYARSKYFAELAIQQLVNRYPATRYIILRPRGLFGPHDRVLLPRLLAQIRHSKGKLILPAGGKNTFDLTYVGNVVHSMQLATQKPDLSSGATYNITNQQPQPLILTLQQLFQQLALKCHIKSVPYPLLWSLAALLEAGSYINRKEPLLTRYSVGAAYFTMTLNNQKAQQELGYYPVYDMKTGIELTANWLNNKAIL
ncbi:NAD(P)-dependent oxidoreductase [Moellerella wisconsensis]|uniref:NAD-dependent epimerase/dehydratase family protein n=1 Tax=Moellerella wisconsensis TaxID=158849 RepID=UPI001F4ED13A|nr:NAD(P)-dependent oxidoreductase [Moellerella wisconsensis]UNH41411.1 NAD(P)-dependent oxidoreductase [Moellerella wisconsensis]